MAFYDPKVMRLIQSVAPNIKVGKGATKQLNAELTTEGKEITRRALKYMAMEGRKTIKARDIESAYHEILLERQTSELKGKEFDYEEELRYGHGKAKETAMKINKLYHGK